MPETTIADIHTLRQAVQIIILGGKAGWEGVQYRNVEDDESNGSHNKDSHYKTAVQDLSQAIHARSLFASSQALIVDLV